MLLTDGEANTGVTDPTALRKIAESAHAKGIGLSTLGCGTDFDGRLLTDLATAGGGRFTYVKSSEQLPTAFREELHGLLAVAAQNVRLDVTVKGGVISKVYGQPWQQTAPAYQLQIGNLRAGERGSLMLALQPSDFQPGATLQAAVKLTYDTADTSERITRNLAAQSAFAADERSVKGTENEEVILCGAVMDAMDSAMSALQNFDSVRYAQARDRFNQSRERVRQYALSHHNQDLLNEAFLLKHFMAELQALRGPDTSAMPVGSEIEKQTDYESYQLLHHPLAQK